MLLKQLKLEKYRNITAASIEPSRYLTILHGLNGQGKTNLIESVFMLGTGRAFRTSKVTDLIQHGTNIAIVSGLVQTTGIENRLFIQMEGSTRRVLINGKTVQRSAELHGKLAVVIFSPDDTGMVKQGPETRRRYLDRSLYSSNAGFLHNYHSYYRTLKQRNALLKSNQHQELALWTEQLAIAGVSLMEYRQNYVIKLQNLLKKQYLRIAGINEKVEVRYKPDVVISEYKTHHELLNIINEHQEQDVRYKTTNRGPHRDDLQFLINDRPLKGFGSQGQQRSFVLALKLAELDHLHETFGEEPLLLLDDIASELDRDRIKNLLNYLRQREVQVLITTTDASHFIPVLQHDSRLFRVENGKLTYEGNGVT